MLSVWLCVIGLCYMMCMIVSDVGSNNVVLMLVSVCVVISIDIDGVSVYSSDVSVKMVVLVMKMWCWLYRLVSRLLVSSSIVYVRL